MLRKIIKFVCDKLVERCERNGKVFYITGGVNGKTVYLVRYIVFKSRLGCIYIHRFLRSDADDPHDHPWNFWTYVIDGGYTEVYYDRSRYTMGFTNDTSIPGVTLKGAASFKHYWREKINKRLPGSIAYRKATDIHKVVVDKQLELEFDAKKGPQPEDNEVIHQAPYTICVMGKRRREWGFWQLEDGYPDGSKFIDWRRYLNVKLVSDPRIEGGE